MEGVEVCFVFEEVLGWERGWFFWMGSFFDFVLVELRCSWEREGFVVLLVENEEGVLEFLFGGIKWGYFFGF